MSITTMIMFEIPPTDSMSAVTMSFMDLLWFSNLRGLRVLSNRRILITERSIEDTLTSIREHITINKSSYDHSSLR